MARKSPKELLGKLQELGYGRGRSAPSEEGMRDIILEAIVEAVVALHNDAGLAPLSPEQVADLPAFALEVGAIISAAAQEVGEVSDGNPVLVPDDGQPAGEPNRATEARRSFSDCHGFEQSRKPIPGLQY